MVNKRIKARKPRRNGGGSSQAVGTYVGDAWSLAKRTALGLNEIRKLINVEEKYHEVQNSTTFDRAGAIAFLSAIEQGDGVSQREGNSLKVQHYKFRFFIKHNPSTTAGTCHRVLIVRDLQNQGATITAAEVMETVGGAEAPLAFRDFVNGPLQNKRFGLVYDKTFVTDPYNQIKHDSFESAHDCHVYFRGATNGVSSAGNGTYFLVALSSDTGANLPSIFYSSRIEFTDN